MSPPPLDSTPFGMNTTFRITSPIDSIPVVTKTPDPTLQTRPMEFSTRPTDSSNQKLKVHVPADLESDLSLSDSSSNESDLSNDTNYSKSNKNKGDMKKKCRKHKKQDLSESSSRDYGSSYDSNYRRK